MSTFTNDTRWVEEFPGAVTVCDTEGTILSLNAKARKTFESDGGGDLVGKSLFDCHNDHSKAMIRNLLETGEANAYTIEKKGVKKVIFQSAWFENGKIGGLVELSLEVPFEMRHFVR